MEKLEQIQGEQLRSILRVGKSTPYIGILMETGVWPIKEILEYKMIMLYHNLIHSDDQRLAKMILREEKRAKIKISLYGKCCEIAEATGGTLEDVGSNSKYEWKKEWKFRLGKKRDYINKWGQ